MIAWHETVFMLCLVSAALFYIYVFAKTIDAYSLVVSCLVLILTAFLQDMVSTITFLYALAGASFIPVFQGHAVTLYHVGKPAIGGFFEELFRSVFVVLHAKTRRENAIKKNKVDYSYINILDNQVFGLAFLYGGIESCRMTLQAFPSLFEVVKGGGFNPSAFATEKFLSIHPVLVIAFFIAMALRYYLHLRLLQFSIYSLTAGRKRLYLLSLLFHFSAGATFGFYETGSIEHSIISILVIETIFVGAMTVLLGKLRLREQIISNTTNQAA